MQPALSFSLPQEQIVAVNLNLRDPQTAHLLERIAAAQREGERRVDYEERTYHMGATQTEGCPYDDRLTTRLKCSATKAYEYLKKKRGGLQHYRIGKEYRITEWAVRQFEGRPAQPLPNQQDTKKP